MRFLSAAFALCLALSTVCVAQESAVPTLRTQVRLTTVDVVVTDSKGNPVHGLKQDDFEVFENKKSQRMTSFEEHVSPFSTTYDKPRPGVFTNATTVRGGVNNVLLLDFLNTPANFQPYLRSQLVKYLLAQKPGTRTAIFAMGSSLKLLQDFTSDPAELKAVLVKLGTRFSPLANPKDLANDPLVEMYTDAMQRMAGSGDTAGASTMAAKVQTLNDFVTREQSMTIRNNALLTITELTDVARNLAGVNGRKNVFWLSGSFPAYIQRDVNTTGSPFKGNEDMTDELRDTVNSLATAQVALYPVDSRGQQGPPSLSGDGLNDPANLGARQVATSNSGFNPQDQAFYTAQSQEHSTMNDLAEGTGGQAFYNTNDIAGSVAAAQVLGAQYYTLTYTPPLDAKPGKYRDIKVQVKGKGLHLSYRRGYYTPQDTGGKAVPMNTAKTSRAMQPEAPQSSEVLFQLEVSRPPVDVNSAKVIGGPVLEELPHGTYQLNALVDFSTVQFSPDSEGKMHGVVDVATVIYDKGGKVIDSRSDRASLALDTARYQAMLKGGMRYHQVVAVPDKGDGFVRVAVHDGMTDKLGTVQISMANLRDAGQKVKQ